LSNQKERKLIGLIVAGRTASKSLCFCLTLWRPLGFGDFRKKKTPKRTWLCAGISPVWYALQTR